MVIPHSTCLSGVLMELIRSFQRGVTGVELWAVFASFSHSRVSGSRLGENEFSTGLWENGESRELFGLGN